MNKRVITAISIYAIVFLISCNRNSDKRNEIFQNREKNKNTKPIKQNENNEANEEMHYGAIETYRYWAGKYPEDDIKVINGQYWSSSHFTKEYVMYLELKAPKKLVSSFPKDNNLKLSNEKNPLPVGAPAWFKPTKKFQIWLGQQGSMYFINNSNGHVFFYEVQL